MAYLIKFDSCTLWEDMIQDIADDDQAERILAIPISKPKPLDTMVWRHEGTCVYTIKSGNKLLLREKLQMLGAYSTHLTKAIAMFHIEMWALQILGKIKIALWKMYNDFLPTFGNLNKCNMHIINIFPLC